MNAREIGARLGQAVVTIYAVITISFALIRLMPGGPVTFIKTQMIRKYPDMDIDQINQLVETYVNVNPDEPIIVEYFGYLWSVLQGDLGRSIFQGVPVTELLANGLPWTIFYAGISLLISFALGIVFGAIMAYTEGSRFDVSSTVASIVLTSVPFYVFGVLFIAVLGYQYDLFPTGGRLDTSTTPGINVPFVLGVLHHAALPIISSVLTAWGGFALSMRGNSISVLGEDYIRVARLRGLSSNHIATQYVGRNAILPLYTSLMISIGFIIGGSTILETVFQYRGIGLILYDALIARDMPVMMGAFLLITIIVALSVLLADLTYAYIDPRAEGAAGARETYGTGSVSQSLRRAGRRLVSGGGPSGDESTAEWSLARPGELPFEIEPADEGRGWLREWVESVTVTFAIAWNDWRMRLGLFIIGLYVLMGTVGVVAVETTAVYDSPGELPPFQSMEHPLGTDRLGQDLLSLVVHATPAMLKMILAGAVFATGLATVVGTVAGYRGGLADRVLTTFSDVMMTIPGLPLIMVIAIAIEPTNPWFVGVLLSINRWAGLARTIRSEVISMREQAFVESARLMGIPTRTILRKEVIPNLMPYILVNFVGAGRAVIFGSVGLYFLGILPFSNLNWGVILNQAYENGALIVPDLLYWLAIPILVIVLLSMALILIAQGLDRIFNPRIRARHRDEEATVAELGN